MMRSLLGAVVLAWVALAGPGALGAPVLVVIEDSGDADVTRRTVLERLGGAIVINNLGRHYDRVDLLSGPNATKEKLFELLRKRGERRDVDVMVLAHGSSGNILLQAGDLSAAELAGQTPFPRLRMVYMMACYSSTMVEAWRKAGARLVIGHQDYNSLPGFFFSRFARRWGEGWTARDAAADAYRFSEESAYSLGRFIDDDENLLDSLGIARSEPVLSGENIDRTGRAHPVVSLRIPPLGGRGAAARSSQYEHSGFQDVTTRLVGTLVPQVTVSPERIPSAGVFIGAVRDQAWRQLRDNFPPPLGGFAGSGGPTEDEVWIDGRALAWILEPVLEWAGDKAATILERIQGVRLERRNGRVDVSAYFDRAFDLEIRPESGADDWELYTVHVPPAVRLSLSQFGERLFVNGLDGGVESLQLKAKLPYMPDTVYLRNASLDLESGAIRVEAGIFGNNVALVAGASIETLKEPEVDVWDTIAENGLLVMWPSLHFSLR